MRLCRCLASRNPSVGYEVLCRRLSRLRRKPYFANLRQRHSGLSLCLSAQGRCQRDVERFEGRGAGLLEAGAALCLVIRYVSHSKSKRDLDRFVRSAFINDLNDHVGVKKHPMRLQIGVSSPSHSIRLSARGISTKICSMPWETSCRA